MITPSFANCSLFLFCLKSNFYKKKGAYPVQRAPALCGVWGRVLVASLTLAYAMRGDRDYKFVAKFTNARTSNL